MDNHENSINSDHQIDEKTEQEEEEEEEEEEIVSTTEIIDGDTYRISDNESPTDSAYLIETNILKHEEQYEFNDNMSQDSLINEEEDDHKNTQQPLSSSITVNSRMNNKSKLSTNGARSINLDEHIKLIKQKKEEAESLRVQRFQEQMKKKEQKWQQQQIEKVKKWLQLRNRDTEHRSQVEERRKKRDEEAKAKFDDILRREKEREQRTYSQITTSIRTHASHRPDSLMSTSTDIISNRRAISAPRIRSNQQDMTNRRELNDSLISATHQENVDNPTIVISSHPENSNDENFNSNNSNDVTMTNEDSSLSGTPHSSAAHRRARPVPTSYTYWINTGDNNNHLNANFMRSTYSAICRSRLSRSVERCPRSGRGQDELTNNTLTTNGDPQRRIQSINRQQLDATITRLSKPKHSRMSQSIHANTTTSSLNGISTSQSSHQIRVPTPPVTTNNNSTSLTIRRRVHSRPATAPTNDSRSTPTNESTLDNQSMISSIRQTSHRSNSKIVSSKPPTASSRSKTSTQRSLISTSQSSSALSSTTTTNKQNIRRIGGLPPSTETVDNQTSSKNNEEEDNNLLNNETTEEEKIPQPQPQPTTNNSSIEPINIDVITELINPSQKREQPTVDEQEYQRKLNQKIREAQQRLEAERQREEERKRQLELEEYEREQEQIRLEQEQQRAEQERLQRAIEEREREDELKRQEEQRLQQQREELERKQAEEAERLQRERQEKTKKEEEERNERKKRLDSIMRRTRQSSPSPKPENNVSKQNTDEIIENDNQQSIMSHSISDSRFPTSSSNENILNQNDSNTNETPKFKSPLIQSLLNKARNTRSTDNLTQSNMTTSQIMSQSMIDDETTQNQSTIETNSSDDDKQNNSKINGHTDKPSTSTEEKPILSNTFGNMIKTLFKTEPTTGEVEPSPI